MYVVKTGLNCKENHKEIPGCSRTGRAGMRLKIINVLAEMNIVLTSTDLTEFSIAVTFPM